MYVKDLFSDTGTVSRTGHWEKENKAEDPINHSGFWPGEKFWIMKKRRNLKERMEVSLKTEGKVAEICVMEYWKKGSYTGTNKS